MEDPWKPKMSIRTTSAGLVAEIELGNIRKEHLDLVAEGRELRVRGQGGDSRPFETAVQVPLGYELQKASATYQKGVLRIQVPGAPGSPPSLVGGSPY